MKVSTNRPGKLTGRRRMARSLNMAESLEERLVFSPLITLGAYHLLPNTADQKINIYVGGGDAGIQGVDLEIMTGDAGPLVGGKILAPQITGVNLLATGVLAPDNSGDLVSTNTLFSSDNNGIGGVGQVAGGQFFDIHTLVNSGIGNVALSGSSMDPVSGRTNQALLAVVTIDTTGFSVLGSSFNISVDGSVNGGPVITQATDFPPELGNPPAHNAGFTDGLLVIGNSTATQTAAAASVATYGDTSANLSANVNVFGSPATPATEGTVTFSVLNAMGQQIGSSVSGTVSSSGVATAPFNVAGLNAGSYQIQATYSDGGVLFADSAASAATLTLGRATLTVTATANSKTYGQTASDSGNVSGIQNGDPITATFSSTGDGATATVNTYAITDLLSDGGTGKLANYLVHFTGANLTVNQATLTVTATANSKTYGQTASDSGNVSGIKNGDPIAATFSSTGDGATAAVNTYAITDLLSDAGTGKLANYLVNFTGANLTVNKATLTVTAAANSKTYGQTASDSGNVSGIKNGDPITATFSSSGDGATAGVNTYAITDLLSDGGTGKLANYLVNFTGANLTVNKAALTVTATANSKVFGQTAVDHGTVSGMVNSDPITATFSSTGDPASAAVGSYPITDTLSDAGTGKLANYSVNFTGANLTVSSASSTVATPTFSVAGGTYTSPVTVTISDATSGAAIHYTLDGTTPTASSATYSTGLAISSPKTLKAIAVKSGLTNSAIASATYTIAAATPVFTPATGTYVGSITVKITDATSGAAIHYTTDGSTPTASSPLYSAAFTVGLAKTVKAIAIVSGRANSAVASATYSFAVAAPVMSQKTGTYINSVSVTLTSATSGAVIHYTLDGTTPTASSPTYTAALSITSTKTLQAIAIKSGLANSAVSSATYTIVPSASIVALTSGVAVSSLSGAAGSQKFFKLVVPSGKTKLTLTISGGTGDANLYLRLSSLPTTSTYTSRSILAGNTDSITLASPAAGTYYFLLYGNLAFSGVTIKATYS
jgi:hypothetical protein